MSGLVRYYTFDVSLVVIAPKLNAGPRELSICDPKAIPLILGFSSKTFKGPFYDSMEDSVSTTRDKVFHKQRRKVWDSSMKQCKYCVILMHSGMLMTSPQYLPHTAPNWKRSPTHCLNVSSKTLPSQLSSMRLRFITAMMS